MSVTCVAGILAGGASKRFGRPKALLELAGGRTIIEHVAAVASSVAEAVVILGNAPGVPASMASVPVLPDAVPDSGPMGGLCSLLEYAAPHWALLLACDLPALQGSVLRSLLEAAGDKPDADVVAFHSEGVRNTYETCCALYHPRVHSRASDALRSGATGLQELLRQVRTYGLVPSESQARALFDIDTAQDADTLGDLLA